MSSIEYTMSVNRMEGSRSGLVHASYCCQRCSQPLRLDPSFSSIEQHVFTDLTAPMRTVWTNPESSASPTAATTYKVDETEELSRGIVRKVSAAAAAGGRYESADSGNDFTMISKDDSTNGENLTYMHKLHVTGELFNILSSQSQIDHPLCEECTDNLLDQLDQMLKATEDECKDYKEFLDKLNNETEDVDEESLEQELKQLRCEEDALESQLEDLERNHRDIVQKICDEKEKSRRLSDEEKRYYKDYNEYKRQLVEYEDAQRSVDNQLKYAQVQLDKLTKTNVFNATFHIWHNGHFGTINNFRLGRLPNIPVEWNEINAAWGQTVLLLHSLANKIGMTFERYRLVPYGSHSYIECLNDKAKDLPLWVYGGWKFFWDNKFDQAMVAFLDCLQQFKENIAKSSTSFRLPYNMDKGRIEETSAGISYSIRIQFNTEEQWTKALKFMLTNLKWGLAFVSSQFANKD